MPGPQLIFLEGMTGAGKSTNALHLEAWLRARGEAATAYHEFAEDNPIRTRGVDAMRAAHPTVEPLPDTGPDGMARDPSVYAVEQWGRLAGRCCPEAAETVILESRYMQNSVQPRFINGAPAEKVREGFARIVEQVAPARPLLVYLRPTDVSSAILRTLAERGDPWASWLVKSFEGYGFNRERRHAGPQAVIAFYEAWEQLAEELFASHPGPKLWLEDPARDWSASVRRILLAARPEGDPALPYSLPARTPASRSSATAASS